jgi:hypothetical protein
MFEATFSNAVELLPLRTRENNGVMKQLSMTYLEVQRDSAGDNTRFSLSPAPMVTCPSSGADALCLGLDQARRGPCCPAYNAAPAALAGIS